MRPIPIQLTRDEVAALADVLAYGLRLTQPIHLRAKLQYLLLSKLYTRLFTKLPFLRPTQRISFRAEEACALLILLEEELPPAFWAQESYQTLVAQRVLAELHQKLS